MEGLNRFKVFLYLVTIMLKSPDGEGQSTLMQLHVTKVFKEGIELSWVPPVHSSRDVYYFISSIRGQVTNTINTTRNMANLTGLEPGMTYNITVVAVNSAGMREWAGEEIYTHNPSVGSTENSKSSPSIRTITRTAGRTDPTESDREPDCPSGCGPYNTLAVTIVVAIILAVIIFTASALVTTAVVILMVRKWKGTGVIDLQSDINL